MAWSVAVASGKGGTGKTTVAVGLFSILSGQTDGRVQLVDCDVEEPNDLLFFPESRETGHLTINKRLPVIDTSRCTFCRRCADYCEFNAIVVIPTAEYAAVNASLCHSCGACLVACNDNAITEVNDPIGEVTMYETGLPGTLIEGRLRIGSAMQTMLIRYLKEEVPGGAVLNIFDAPPGTSCPVVETVADADFVVLVAEPTPFGLHDLRLTAAILEEMKKPYGVVINKAGRGSTEIYDWMEREQVFLLGEIPFSRQFAEHYARGSILNGIPQDTRQAMEDIAVKLMKQYRS